MQRLEVRICDVEGSLRFSNDDLKSWKEVSILSIQNIVKCLKLFHTLAFVIEEQKNTRISSLLKRILHCVSIIFSRSIPTSARLTQ